MQMQNYLSRSRSLLEFVPDPEGRAMLGAAACLVLVLWLLPHHRKWTPVRS